MRFRSSLLVAFAAIVGILAALGRPWYGPSGAAADEPPMNALFNGIARAFSETDGTTGWAALEKADSLVAGLAGATAIFLLLGLLPAIAPYTLAFARWTALATLGVIVVKLVDEPGDNVFAEPRFGILVALGCAAMLVAATSACASEPPRRRAAPRTYTPPPAPAPAPAPESSWGPPQF